MNEQTPNIIFYILIFAITVAFAAVLLLDRTNAQEIIEGDGITPEGEVIDAEFQQRVIALRAEVLAFNTDPDVLQGRLDRLREKYNALRSTCN